MQATGQYGEVPQYVASRVGASHGHMFNISHEMSLSSAQPPAVAGGLGHGHGHGHGLSLSHPPRSQASQSHMPLQVLSAPPSQPSFHQSTAQSHHHQQQQQQHGFSMTMGGGAAPKTSAAPLPPHAPQALQSAALQQQAADTKQHQQHVQQESIGEHVQPKNPQQAIGEQERQQQQQSSVPRPELETASPLPHTVSAEANKGGITREESVEGDEQDEEGEKGSGGNRWPRQEALALLKIRSEMDAAFRDSSLKGPLWEEISRKLAEMGYHRTAKKCKEKFENVHKYYKRTKEGKTGRQDGKSYRFFSQLEALYSGKPGGNTALANLSNIKSPNVNNSSSNTGLLSLNHGDNGTAGLGFINPANNNHGVNLSTAFPPPFNAISAVTTTNAHIASAAVDKVESFKHESKSSGALQAFIETSDDDDDDDDEDDEFDEPAARERASPATQNSPKGKKRKRKPMMKYLAFFEKVMKKVLDKQEHMQQKFLEALERRDQDRMIREETWKRQEMARLNREHDVRAAERALSASREASLVAFLQKMTGQSIPLSETSMAVQQPNNQQSTAIVPADYMQNEMFINNAERDVYDPSSKRWPKPEVLALIKLRTSLDRRFHEPGSKAVLWEEISAGMTAQGFDRTAKRCKEKWENINKYFKKAKESNKKRPENAKTCPYFHHLNALYKEGLLRGGSFISSKLLMVTEKGEEQSQNVMEGHHGNTSNNGEEYSGQAQEGDSEALPAGAGEIGSNLAPANVSAMASIDAKMHMFMASVSGGKDASMNKTNEGPSLAMDSSGGMNNCAATTNSLPFNLDQGMSSSKS